MQALKKSGVGAKKKTTTGKAVVAKNGSHGGKAALVVKVKRSAPKAAKAAPRKKAAPRRPSKIKSVLAGLVPTEAEVQARIARMPKPPSGGPKTAAEVMKLVEGIWPEGLTVEEFEESIRWGRGGR